MSPCACGEIACTPTRHDHLGSARPILCADTVRPGTNPPGDDFTSTSPSKTNGQKEREITVKRMLALTSLLLSALASSGPSGAQEEAFFASLDGEWAGKGSVRIEADSAPLNVRCKFSSDTTASSMALDGSCTGLAVFSREIGATIKGNGSRYSGVYRGSSTGPAALSGKQSGNALNLAIRWAADVNGDRSAQLRLEKVGGNGMRLTTMDEDPESGKSVVISRIDLRRL